MLNILRQVFYTTLGLTRQKGGINPSSMGFKGLKKDFSAYKAILSSDWNECLAPCGPFDAIMFTYPALATDLEGVFRQYTNNRMTLGAAAEKIGTLLPAPLTPRQMDAYLDAEFCTYTGVPELIQWCLSREILFMINTTGMIGYFQRIFAKGLLPQVPVLAAHPMIRYLPEDTDPPTVLPLLETPDKGRHTESVAREAGVPFHRVGVMGDSGGDGPHFEWGARVGAYRIGSMTKTSLMRYCRDRGIPIHHQFGPGGADGEIPSRRAEMAVDFMGLTPILAECLLKKTDAAGIRSEIQR
jgi:hypothetical protein